jgi:uncharacterized protein (TIRG00374 family)
VNLRSEVLTPILAPRRSRLLRPLRLGAVTLGLAAVLFFALRAAPLAAIWASLRHLTFLQVGVLLLANVLVLTCMTARWWLVLRAESRGLPFLPLIGYRLAVFGLSYFTPGPQVGGESLQIMFLRKHHGLSFARAASAVIIDKLLEFGGNFLFISLGLFAVLRAGLLRVDGLASLLGWLVLAVAMLWPPAHLFLLWRGRHPLSRLLRLLLPRFARRKWFRLAVVSEHLAGTFTRRHPAALLAAFAASLLAWSGMAVEYLLILNFLSVHLPLWGALASLTASMLAFLMPLPGGLGALEASQVLALGSLGYPAATAIGVTLIMRARDLLNGGLGLLLAGRSFGR